MQHFRKLRAWALVLWIGSVASVVHADGFEVRRFHQGTAPDDRYGLDVAILDDVDGDGMQDYAVASPRFGVVEIRSGATGTLLLTLSGTSIEDDFGISIARIEDQNGDGLADLAVGAWLYDAGGVRDTGAVFIYSATNGVLIDQIGGTVASEELGTTVVDAGDVDGDGVHDIAIGAPGFSTPTEAFAGRVLVYSTATSSVIWSISGGSANQRLGREVAAAGDLDGDGSFEVAIGDPLAESGDGVIRIHAGPTGTLFRTLVPTVPGETGFGRALTTLSDRDGDGQPELGCVSRDPLMSVATVLSSVDGSPLARPAEARGSGFELLAIHDAEDLDLDATADLLVHSHGAARIYDSAGFNVLDEWSTELLNLGTEVPAIEGPVDFDGDGREEYLCGFSYLAGTSEAKSGGAAILERREPGFIRGDVVTDANVDLADVVAILQYLFVSANPDCLAAADLGDDGTVDVSDAILLLAYLFASGAPPADPFPDCGVDPTGPALPCGVSTCAGPTPLLAILAPTIAVLPPIPASPAGGAGVTFSSEAVVWCFDATSSSSLGGTLGVIQEEVSAGVASLESWQKFNLVRYGSSVTRFAPQLLHGSPANALDAESWIDGAIPNGNACLEEALTESLRQATASLRRERSVVLFSVGNSTCDPSTMLPGVTEANRHGIPIHVIHFSTSATGISLMQQIALQSGGTFTLVN
ncbi:MAG: hypothetical protein AAF488_09275 [Planctomycetota bacterium]